MNAKCGVRGLAAGLAFLLLPVTTFGHDIVPWGAYPSAGDVVIRTKAKRLLDGTFLGQVLTVAQTPAGTGTVYEMGLGANVSPLYGFVDFTNSKGSKAKLTVEPNAITPWVSETARLLRQYIESKGRVVQDVSVTVKTARGRAKFKTKPSPIGPYHKVSMRITIKFMAIVTLEGGGTKKGIVKMIATSKGVRLGLPGGD